MYPEAELAGRALSDNWAPGEFTGPVAELQSGTHPFKLGHPERPEHPPGWHRDDSCLILCPYCVSGDGEGMSLVISTHVIFVLLPNFGSE